MRVSKEKAAQNRQDLLTTAARLFREQGVSATGVDAITEDVNLTTAPSTAHKGKLSLPFLAVEA
jgi:TetR/AcrR family transcriptional repressor of nem operon